MKKNSLNLTLLAGLASLTSLSTYAQLNLPVPVTPGSTIRSDGFQMTITPGTQRSIYDWSSFNIGQGYRTTFKLPTMSAAVLNRVGASGGASLIDGTLESLVGSQHGGSIYLINPNGVLVGASGRINVGSFVASTLDLGPDTASANASFLSAGKLNLSGGSFAGIKNEGQISARDDVFIVAHTVENVGTIRAGRNVGLAAGTQVELNVFDPRNPLAERITVVAGSGTGTPVGVNNTAAGTITAVTEELKAAGGNVYGLAIQNAGKIRATALVNEGGRIVLKADKGNVANSGVLDASATQAGGQGGTVEVLGDSVSLNGDSRVDVRGDAGGGVALIGGDYQGKNALVPNSQQTFVGRNAVIAADAINSGNGGKVIVWADQITRFYGTLTAKGGKFRGNGGLVEISGKHYLDYQALLVDLTAPAGRLGTLLMDPDNIFVRNNNPLDVPNSWTTALNDVDLASDANIGAGYTTISAGSINAALANVTLAANNNITIVDAINIIDPAVKFTANATSIDVNGVIRANGVTLNAATINLNSMGTQANPTIRTTGGGQTLNGAVTLKADAWLTDTAGGAVAFNNTVNSLGGNYNLVVDSLGPINFANTVNNIGVMTLKGGGNTTFNNDVGAASLTVLNKLTLKGNVTTTFEQQYTDTLTLGGAGTTRTLSGTDITFAGITGGGNSLTINGSGNTTFGDNVSGVNNLITDAAGHTYINTLVISTAGGQTYNDPVILGANVVLVDTLGNGNISFNQTVNADNFNNNRTLVVNTGGNTKFAGAVGNLQALRSVTTDAPGKTQLGNNVSTLNEQTYNDPVELIGNVVISSANNNNIGTILFNSTLNADAEANARTIALTTDGITKFVGAVGGIQRPQSVTINYSGQVGEKTIVGSDFKTIGSMIFTEPLELIGNSTIASGANVTFQKTVNGTYQLAVNSPTAITFNDVVGGTLPLTSLTTGNGGNTAINGGAVTTTGNQDYNDTVTLGANTVVASTGSGNLTFAKTVNADAAANNRTLVANT
ncbi:MAG: filamentous hemagglutinin N-terminal domain-containing protein, partial [Verrucomicrobiota bacterium]